MIKIGDFARLSQVSVVTLRYYDEMELLRPIRVDAFTGYRFYSADQLPRLNRILALKDLGFSLEQIKLMLADGLSSEQLRKMLVMQRSDVEKRLSEEQDRLSRIEARLRRITTMRLAISVPRRKRRRPGRDSHNGVGVSPKPVCVFWGVPPQIPPKHRCWGRNRSEAKSFSALR